MIVVNHIWEAKPKPQKALAATVVVVHRSAFLFCYSIEEG